MSTVAEEIKLAERMSHEMFEKLRANSSRRHWRVSTVHYLFGRLMQEVEELRDAVYNQDSTVWEEAADIANFAAMIADNNVYE